MDLTLDTKAAKAADTIASGITEAGKYIGTITRAEALKSTNGTLGLGLSFRTDSGQSADYLDIYTHKADGEALMGSKTVNALLVCLKLRGAKQGRITCDKWDSDARARVKVEVAGYPELMGKRIGLLLQKELGTNNTNGKDTERMTIFGVFSPDTELTASEILDSKVNPERLPQMVQALMARPVRDNRKRQGGATRPTAAAAPAGGFADMDDDIPF
jgi:hypothetical protein